MRKSRFLLVMLCLVCLLTSACGGSTDSEVEPTATELPAATEVPTDEPTDEPTEAPEDEEVPEPDDDDFPPGTRLEAVNPLAANQEASIVLMANVGDSIVVGIEPGADQDIALGLFYFAPNGSEEMVGQVNDGPGFESFAYTFQVAGIYRLAIRELSGTDGVYALRVAATPGIALTATPLYDISGNIQGQNLGYLHDGYAGQEATFNVVPAPGYTDLDLSLSIVSLADMNTVLMEVNENGPGQGETATFLAPADDEYYISVQAENSTGVFNLTMTEP